MGGTIFSWMDGYPEKGSAGNRTMPYGEVENLFLHGFWPKCSKILHKATLSTKKSKLMQSLTNILKQIRKQIQKHAIYASQVGLKKTLDKII